MLFVWPSGARSPLEVRRSASLFESFSLISAASSYVRLQFAVINLVTGSAIIRLYVAAALMQMGKRRGCVCNCTGRPCATVGADITSPITAL